MSVMDAPMIAMGQPQQVGLMRWTLEVGQAMMKLR